MFVSWGNKRKQNCPKSLDTSVTNLNIKSYQNKFWPTQIELQDPVLEICFFNIFSSNGKAKTLSGDILNVSSFLCLLKIHILNLLILFLPFYTWKLQYICVPYSSGKFLQFFFLVRLRDCIMDRQDVQLEEVHWSTLA